MSTTWPDVRRFEAELLEYFRSRHADLLDTIRNEGGLPDEARLGDAVKGFKEQFTTSEQAEPEQAEPKQAEPAGAPEPAEPEQAEPEQAEPAEPAEPGTD